MPVNAEGGGVTYFTHQIRIKSNLTADDFPLRVYVDGLPISDELKRELNGHSLHICRRDCGTYIEDPHRVTLSEGGEYFDVEFSGGGTFYDVVLSFARGYYTKNKNGIIERSRSTIKEEFPKNKYPTEYLRNLLRDFIKEGQGSSSSFEIQVLRRSRHRRGKWTGDYTQMPCASYKSYRWTTSLSGLFHKLPMMKGPLIVRCRINRRCEWGYFFILKRSLTGWHVYKLHKRDTHRRENMLIYKAGH